MVDKYIFFIVSIFNKLHNHSNMKLEKDYITRINKIMVNIIDALFKNIKLLMVTQKKIKDVNEI